MNQYIPGQIPAGTPLPQQNRLETVAKLMKQAGNPNARPDGWFLQGGNKKVNQPDKEGGGKWLCGALVRHGVITLKQFYMLARGHALAILLYPNFAYWYLTVFGRVVSRAERLHFDWNSFPAAKIEREWKQKGFRAAFALYKDFCHGMWVLHGQDLPWMGSVRFGGVKMLFTSWFWCAIPRFIKYQMRLGRI